MTEDQRIRDLHAARMSLSAPERIPATNTLAAWTISLAALTIVGLILILA